MITADELRVRWDRDHQVSGILEVPARADACLVLAHGAGAGMRHSFLNDIAHALHERQVATLRFQFPAMEAGSRRPDSPATAHATVRAAVAEARGRLPRLALFAGGKSFGGRMTSQAQSIDPLAGVRGLVFFGFPLHPGGRPSIKRADHLADVHLPMLFLQGTRDTLAAIDLISAVVSATDSSMFVVNDADHAFHVRKSSGGTDEQALNEMASAVVGWMDDVRARES